MAEIIKTQTDKTTREERLAAKLRENLRRRKTQARALTDSNALNNSDDSSLPKDSSQS